MCHLTAKAREMTVPAEVEGIEFDWFAVDSSGSLALFATAGAGFVPSLVLSHAGEHDAISQGVLSPHWGTEKVWDGYADLGLWVYDWKLHEGPYFCVRKPSHEMAEGLRRRLLGVSSLPRFEGKFQHDETITSILEFP
jgi:hypothetical protein